jgi:RimJ/RimL family protein N-acetyltransferase
VHIGDLAFKLKDDGRQAEIGFTFDRKYQKKGYALEAVGSLLDYFFKKLHLHRVIAITDEQNQASWKLLEKLGFRKEGHYIQNILFKGSWGNEFLYAILDKEWERK